MTALSEPSSEPGFASDPQRTIRVAVAQIAPTLGNVPANVELHLKAIEQAQEKSADLVIFPELSLTGYYLRDQVAEVAQSLGDESLLGEVIEATRSLTVGALVGLVEAAPGPLLYNSAVLIGQDRLLDVHRKVYLPTYGMFDEQRYFAAGNRLRVLPTRWGRLGVLICEDAWHLSSAMILAADRMDWLVLMCNSPGRGVATSELGSKRTWETLVQTYARFLNVPVVFANRAGYEDGVCFWGGSQIVDASGNLLAQARELETDLITATLDPKVTRRRRLGTPLHRDERSSLVVQELERIADESFRNGEHSWKYDPGTTAEVRG